MNPHYAEPIITTQNPRNGTRTIHVVKEPLTESFGVFTEDGLDCTVYGTRQASKHAKELRAMDIGKVTILWCERHSDMPAADDMAFDAVQDCIRFEGHFPGKVRLKMISNKYGVTLRKVVL